MGLVRLSASVIVIASPGLLAEPGGDGGGGSWLARAAVSEAAALGLPIYILAPSTMMGGGFQALLGGERGGGAGDAVGISAAAGDLLDGPLSEMVR